ncbi:MAG: hypothetical protein A2Y82_03500 [Candidatus Buchananbacteria bacterium RBG_13_36_9]|uniref:DUF5666 domain-containing protein n=1 Tax=Candidatus Buchananbacteria bacterium RBG_13_36_9 TaxID=1797530 RepID=A0A1G1XNJ9_9BACT|nr:MAG: hypothetical protein A2Y82_03500 [Candidatus Buchananbacteria bacterium RBG_13_36_9]
MDINKIFGAKLFQGIIIGIAVLIVLLLVFKAGTMVGIKKADFSCRWSDNYHRNFGGPKGGFWGGFGDRDFMDANGTFGQIIKVEGNLLTIKGSQSAEKVILLNESTVIKSMKETIKPADLKVDDNIVVIGEPNESGQIIAKLIRLLPPPPTSPPPMGKPF